MDECSRAGQNPCEVQGSCVDTATGYNCSCNPGYALNNDGRTCEGKLE